MSPGRYSASQGSAQHHGRKASAEWRGSPSAPGPSLASATGSRARLDGRGIGAEQKKKVPAAGCRRSRARPRAPAPHASREPVGARPAPRPSSILGIFKNKRLPRSGGGAAPPALAALAALAATREGSDIYSSQQERRSVPTACSPAARRTNIASRRIKPTLSRTIQGREATRRPSPRPARFTPSYCLGSFSSNLSSALCLSRVVHH